MCVIAYKPLNVAFPEERILKNCFENNDDGAGFMYAFKGEVHIQKGYETFEKFMAALNKARAITGDKVPYVMHFRIATQGYEKTMTHPFPLSSKMSNLKKLKVKCSIGVAHNGILSLTSDGAKTYSDTMLFITDYLSNIIQDYKWHENARTKKLIEKLIEGSRLAILDAKGHCELMGKGWVKDGDMHYSNSSYAREPYKWPSAKAGSWNRAWYFEDDEYEDYYGSLVWDREKKRYVRRNETASYKRTGTGAENKGTVSATAPAAPKPVPVTLDTDPWRNHYYESTKKYDFEEDFCPVSIDGDDSYCSKCANCAYCSIQKAVSNAKTAAEA